jgi:acetyl/propionyl-CoA carboxylase alpha subunit
MAMTPHLLVANRAESALRILRTARRLGWSTTLLCSQDDAHSLPARLASAAVVHPATGPQAYLDRSWIVAQAQASGAQWVHPGIGFLSEDAALAQSLADAGIGWIGPSPDTLKTLGDKQAALRLATKLGVLCPQASGPLTGLKAALEYWQGTHSGDGERQAMMLKAIAGGGGRGIRVIRSSEDLQATFDMAGQEAQRAFGQAGLYLETLIEHARHIEVQVVGDGLGAVQVLGTRDCSIQRRHQKLIELAPADRLGQKLEQQLKQASLEMARALSLCSLATFEFLVRGDTAWFIEANPRLQIEHTLTEQLTGLDLVELQLHIAQGATLEKLNLAQEPASRGQAIEVRINAEQGPQWMPSTGTITRLSWPGGPAVRMDSALESGAEHNGLYDSMIAKLIVSRADHNRAALFQDLLSAMAEVRIDGLATNLAQMSAAAQALMELEQSSSQQAVDVLWFERWSQTQPAPQLMTTEPASSSEHLFSPVPGRLVQWLVTPGEVIQAGQVCAIVEAMKMEHEVLAPRASLIVRHASEPGAIIQSNQVIALLQAVDGEQHDEAKSLKVLEPSPAWIELQARQALLADAARPQAIAKRHANGLMSARESLALLLDPQSLREYGGFAIAAQRTRRSLDDLIANTPADGLITGIGTINADQLDGPSAQVAVMAYDYTVLAGTQGMFNHKKSDRLLSLAQRHQLPVVIFAEGGGGRPGDVDWLGVAGLDCTTFWHYGRLEGLVPRIAVVAGRCFAGNAALAGASDLVIATPDSSIGMGGPAMIEGGGLGLVAADAVGPSHVQAANGVIDVLCADDREATLIARKIIGLLQNAPHTALAPQPDALEHVIPHNRLRVYNVLGVIRGLVDLDTFIELRSAYGVGVVTGLARIGGRPIGLMSNNPKHLGGALDAAACDKIYDFLHLMRKWHLPVISLCDTPGFMVGPASEAQGMVRKASRLFNISGELSSGLLVVVLRKGYGLGAQAMAGGSFAAPSNIVAWPQAEFGAMGLEGAVRLGFRKELEACPADQREARFQSLLDAAYEKGKALNMASTLEIDHVINPTDTRAWLIAQLNLLRRPAA